MNYEDFYGFESEPFSDIPDPDLFYSGPEHTRALVKLLHVIKKGRALGILTGKVGCGKTTIIRRILAELEGEEDCKAGLLVLTHPGFDAIWFARKVGELMGLNFTDENRTEMATSITKKLYRRYRNGIRTVLLVDEANNITDSEVVEEIRGLLNLELEGIRLVTVILSGMHEMLDNIRNNESLKQRISSVVDLSPLTLTSTKEYINFRLEQAGVNSNVFTEEAYKVIYDHTRGVPRLINVVCDNALLEGALLKKKVVEESIIKRVGEELLLE